MTKSIKKKKIKTTINRSSLKSLRKLNQIKRKRRETKSNKKKIGGSQEETGESVVLSFQFYQSKQKEHSYYIIGNDDVLKYIVSMELQIDNERVSITQKRFFISFPEEFVKKELWTAFAEKITYRKEIIPKIFNLSSEKINSTSDFIQAVPQDKIHNLKKVQSEFDTIVDDLLVVMTIGSQFKDFIESFPASFSQDMLGNNKFIGKLKSEHEKKKSTFRIETSDLEDLITNTKMFILREKENRCQQECLKQDEQKCKKECKDKISEQTSHMFL